MLWNHMNMDKKVRVRFAPSPTGFLHIGGLRTSLYNYLFAKHNKGDFILRIEDTDQKRLVSDGAENILKTLKIFGLDWDECPEYQSARLEIYKEYAQKLIENGKAYWCACTAEHLKEMRNQRDENKEPSKLNDPCRGLPQEGVENLIKSGAPKVLRLKVPHEGETIVEDITHGEMKFKNEFIDDQVLLKSDGFPTYHLANVVDDHLMGITHVIRGDEWLPSTPKHVLLYQAFGWEMPKFAHLPLLLNADKSKLSKRTGDVAVEEYLKKGYLPEALLNFIALLGWNPTADREIYSINELIEMFNLEKVNKNGAVVNFEKLKWINGEYIKKMSSDDLAEKITPWLEKAGYKVDVEKAKGVAKLVHDRLQVFSDIGPEVSFIFQSPNYDKSLLTWKKMEASVVPARLAKAQEIIESIDSWTTEDLERIIKERIAEEGIATGELLWPLRVALTGQEKSPGPFEVAAVLGKEETISRIKKAINILN